MQFGTADNLAGVTFAAFDLPTAQDVLGEVGQLDHINVVSAPDADKAAVGRAIARVLPRGVEVVTGQTVVNEQTSSINQSLSFFSTALLVFAFISLFVGAFTIFNTFSITVGQRTRELALLRVVGASRRQVSRSVLGEAAIVGVISSLIGIGLGVLAALGLEALLSAFGITLPSGPLVFEARTVVVALAVGIGVTVISAISPARRAVRVPPIAAISDPQGSSEVPRRRRPGPGCRRRPGRGRPARPGPFATGYRPRRRWRRRHLRRGRHAGPRRGPPALQCYRSSLGPRWGHRASSAGRTPCAALGARPRRRPPS